VAVLERGKLVALGAPEELIRGLDRELRVEVELLPGDEAAVVGVGGVSSGFPPRAHLGGRLLRSTWGKREG